MAMEMEGDLGSQEYSKVPDLLWGKTFTWEIRGCAMEDIWAITGNFVGVNKWMTTLVQTSELAGGKLQQPGCIRHAILYPSPPSHSFTFTNEKLLLMDEQSHHYIYTILDGSTLPGFSLMKNYVSSVKLSSLSSSSCAMANHPCSAPSDQQESILLQWSFTCHPSSTLTEEEAQNIAFSLYKAAINDLIKHLTIQDNAVKLLA